MYIYVIYIYIDIYIDIYQIIYVIYKNKNNSDFLILTNHRLVTSVLDELPRLRFSNFFQKAGTVSPCV